MGSIPRLTRRQALRGLGRLSLGVGSAAVMAACGENPIVEGSVEKALTKAVETIDAIPVERAGEIPGAIAENIPIRENVELKFVTDHSDGPRGRAMRWGLARFAEERPDISVEMESPDGRVVESLAAQLAEGTPPHVALLGYSGLLRFYATGAFTEITHLLPQMNVAKADYYFIPDAYTLNNIDHSFPQPSLMTGRQFGMPFQIGISGFVGNVTLAENAGVTLPDSENSWTWDDWTEWDARMTDPETGTFGTWARDDYAGQYMPQLYTNGLKKPFDDGLTKTMFDQPEALEAWTYLIDKVFERKTSPTVREANELAGEFGNPFTAGKIGLWPTDTVGATGVEAPRIKDRFTWTLLPEVVAPGGRSPAHTLSMRANLVTVSAELEGNVEEAVLLAVILAGETFQGRVGIERGHLPVNRRALEAPESEVPPPDGMKWLKVYADRPDNRSPFPFEGWETWWRHHKGLAWKGWFGTKSAEEALAACQAWCERYFSFYDGPKPFVREPVYP